MKNGVSENDISIIPSEEKSVDAALQMAKPGDLVVVYGDEIKRCWKQIIYFNRPQNPEFDIEDTQEGAVEGDGANGSYGSVQNDWDVDDGYESETLNFEGLRLIRDKRGVRLANEPEESD